MVVELVRVPPAGIGLPHLDQGVREGAAVTVEHATVDDDPLAERLSGMLAREVGVTGLHALLAEQGPVSSVRA